MHLAARRFIRRVLAIHIALLAIVALIVIGAARSVHQKARASALQQATETQELLAKQTSRGIENYYQAVTNVLELLKPTQEEESTSAAPRGGVEVALSVPPGPPSTTQPGRGVARRNELERSGTSRSGANPGARGLEAATLRKRLIETLWKDVHQRVSLLFVLDLVNPRQRSMPAGNPSHPPATNAADLRLVPHDAFGDDGGLSAEQVVEARGDWLRHIEGVTVSPFARIGGLACNLVVVPLRSMQNRRLLIAVVPIDRIERELLANVNARTATSAILFDDRGTIMSDAHPDLIGTNVASARGVPRISALAGKYLPAGQGGTEAFDAPESVHGRSFPPSLITIEPIEFQQFAATRWWIAIASGLSQVDSGVNNIFGAAALWAIFVVVSVCAILLSTGTQLIRARLRLERLQHEVLERELSQARDIQLNWLPSDHCCQNSIDIAAVNRPANRISGDFYNWFDVGDGRTAVVIGDVTGHGMAAAFLMATTQLLVRSTMSRIGDPGRCLEEVNRQLCLQGFNGQFVTMNLLVLDPRRQRFDVAVAGHPAPLLCDTEGFQKLDIEPELVLGVDAEATFPTRQRVLPNDARILLYTDGVVDAATMAGTRFGMTGLMASVASGPFARAQAVVDAVTQSVDRFRHGHDLSDDLTLVAIHYRSP